MKNSINLYFNAVLLTCLLVFTGCELEADPDTQPLEKIDATDKVIPPVEDADISADVFIGGRWLETTSGFVYMFKPDGTVTVEHHCGLVFTDQFSYMVAGGLLVTYGSEMGSDELFYYTLNVQDEENIWAITPSVRLIYEWNGDDDSGLPDNLDYLVQNDLLGTWQSDAGVYVFKSDGTYTETAEGGQPVEYSYLIRKNRLVSLSRDTPAVLRNSRYTRQGDAVTIYPTSGASITLTR
jgi:hypothetical protein